jgi:hypothetical protein
MTKKNRTTRAPAPAREHANDDRATGDGPQTQSCSCPQLAARSALGLTPWEDLLLDLVRLECTVIATGDERAAEAARELAAGRLGGHGATRMLEGIAGMMRAIRSDRAGPFGFLPPCCAVVSPDERDLIALLRACRFSNAAIIEHRAAQLAQGLDVEHLIAAGGALVAASRAPDGGGRAAMSDAFADLSEMGPRVLH